MIVSLVPEPYHGEERAWYTLLVHAPGTQEKCGVLDIIVYATVYPLQCVAMEIQHMRKLCAPGPLFSYDLGTKLSDRLCIVVYVVHELSCFVFGLMHIL